MSADVDQERETAGPGEAEAAADARRGRDAQPEAGPGTSEAGPGTEAGPVAPEAGPGTSEAGPGMSEAGSVAPEAGPGTSEAGPGTSEAGPGTPEAPAPQSEARPSRRARLLRTAAALVLIAATCFAVGGSLRGAGTEMAEAAGRPGGVLLLIAALLANAAGLVLSMLSWRVLVVDGGSTARTSDTARIFFIGVISKFVPGRIWGVLAHIQLGKAVGIAPERMIAAFGLGLVIGMTTGAAAGLLVAPAVFGAGAWVFAPLVLPAAAAVARPGWVGRLVAWTMRLARRPDGAAEGSPRALRLSIGWACASWAVSGLHLWAIVVLLGAPPLLSLPVCVGGFALATVAGSLAFVLPDGWGARELVLLAPLGAVMPLSAATAAVIASRLVCVLSEVAATGAALAWARAAGPLPTPRPALQEGAA
ncbi:MULTISPECIES: lysylphosphatidylglycerol synthase domain-containing protein [Streptomyces]|uniref:lysylphosphatidylglycerol synthase transmembrane domain-containing protein n=1 Tax=Streptomyces TaxID=1883 RepID=UPI00206F810D|nr:lysylphosphatidylglycerol synthase domain-containing protein [Streptomyces sp. WAC00303]UPT44591.1 lysylphosphatidylglycerol synthase domain-containing protein [Streptomyces sp. WAC00303]